MNSELPRENLLGLAKRLSTQLDKDEWPKDYLNALGVLLFDGKPYDRWTRETWRTIPLAHLSKTLNFKKENSQHWLNEIDYATTVNLVHDVAISLNNRGDDGEHYLPARDIGNWLRPVGQKHSDIFQLTVENLTLKSNIAWAMLLTAGWRSSKCNMSPEKLIFSANKMDIDPRSFYLAVLTDPDWQPVLTTENWHALLKAADTVYDVESYEMLAEKFIDYKQTSSVNFILNGHPNTDEPFCWLRERIKNAPPILSYCNDVDIIVGIFLVMQRHAPMQLNQELQTASIEALQKIHNKASGKFEALAKIILEENLKRQTIKIFSNNKKLKI